MQNGQGPGKTPAPVQSVTAASAERPPAAALGPLGLGFVVRGSRRGLGLRFVGGLIRRIARIVGSLGHSLGLRLGVGHDRIGRFRVGGRCRFRGLGLGHDRLARVRFGQHGLGQRPGRARRRLVSVQRIARGSLVATRRARLGRGRIVAQPVSVGGNTPGLVQIGDACGHVAAFVHDLARLGRRGDRRRDGRGAVVLDIRLAAARAAAAARLGPGVTLGGLALGSVALDGRDRADLGLALDRDFDFRRLIAVIGCFGDKDARGILTELEPHVSEVVCTQSTSPRALDCHELAEYAREIFGDERVHVDENLPAAVETAVALAEETDAPGEAVSGSGVLITGSVVTAGEARTLFGKEPS